MSLSDTSGVNLQRKSSPRGLPYQEVSERKLRTDPSERHAPPDICNMKGRLHRDKAKAWPQKAKFQALSADRRLLRVLLHQVRKDRLKDEYKRPCRSHIQSRIRMPRVLRWLYPQERQQSRHPIRKLKRYIRCFLLFRYLLCQACPECRSL